MMRTSQAPTQSAVGTAEPAGDTVKAASAPAPASSQAAWTATLQVRNRATAGGIRARSINDVVRLSGTNTSRWSTATTAERASASASGSGGSRQRPRARTVTPRATTASIPLIAHTWASRPGKRAAMPRALTAASEATVIPDLGRSPERPARRGPEQGLLADRQRPVGRLGFGRPVPPRWQP